MEKKIAECILDTVREPTDEEKKNMGNFFAGEFAKLQPETLLVINNLFEQNAALRGTIERLLEQIDPSAPRMDADGFFYKP